MNKVVLLIILSLAARTCFSQNRNTYSESVRSAVAAAEKGDYWEAVRMYSKAFQANNNLGRADHRYSAPRCRALIGLPDSAFYQLERAAKGGFRDYSILVTDTVFNMLKSDLRWSKIARVIQTNLERLDSLSTFKPKKERIEIIKILDTIYRDDQLHRNKLLTIKKHGLNSLEIKALEDSVKKYDSINTNKITVILDTFGWLSKQEVGDKGASALFLALQHSNLETQLKYLPKMKVAVKEGVAEPQDFALLSDRIAVRQGKKQVYGSQIGLIEKTGKFYVRPLRHPKRVDKFRANVGLPPLQVYVKQWGIEWSLKNYKRNLKEYRLSESDH